MEYSTLYISCQARFTFSAKNFGGAQAGPQGANVIKLAEKKETAEGDGIPKEIQKELIRKKRQQKQTEAAPSEKGHRKGQRAEA